MNRGVDVNYQIQVGTSDTKTIMLQLACCNHWHAVIIMYHTNSSYVAPADELIEKLNWPTISEIIKRDTVTMVYKSLNGLVPMYLSNIFSKNSTRDTIYLRNSENDVRVPLFKTANGQKSFAYRGAHLWNNLESEVKKAPSLFVFKHRL